MNSKDTLNNLYDVISSAKLDEAVGIRIEYLTGDEEFSLFGAEIAPRKSVGAHYHESGLEIYQIVEGYGVMHTGAPGDDGETAWNEPFEVKKGDCFTIHPGVVHQLTNESDERMILIAGCPKNHLATDRVMVAPVGESARRCRAASGPDSRG